MPGTILEIATLMHCAKLYIPIHRPAVICTCSCLVLFTNHVCTRYCKSPVEEFICLFLSGVASGMYATNSAEACKFICQDCKASIAVVEDQIQLDKFLKVYYALLSTSISVSDCMTVSDP